MIGAAASNIGWPYSRAPSRAMRLSGESGTTQRPSQPLPTDLTDPVQRLRFSTAGDISLLLGAMGDSPSLRHLWMLRAVELNPEAALTALQENGASTPELVEFFVAWLQRAPEDASAALRRTEDYWDVYDQVWRRMASQFPVRLIDNVLPAFKTDSFGIDGDTPFEIAFRSLASDDLDGALRRATALKGWARTAAYSGVAAALATTNRGAALEWAQSLPSLVDKATAIEAVARVWGSDDPDGAAALLKLLPNAYQYGGNHMGAGATIINELVDRDPEAAFAWIERYVDETQWENAVSMAAVQRLKGHPDVLASTIAGIENEKLRNRTIQSLNSYLTDGDYGTMLQGVDRLPEGEVRDKIRAGILGSMACDDPFYAARYLANEGADLPDGSDIWVDVVKHASLANPAHDVTWAMLDLIPADQRGDRTKSLMNVLASRDPLAAAGRLEALTGTPFYNEAAAALAEGWGRRDVAAAMEWLVGADKAVLDGAVAGISRTAARELAPEQTLDWLRSTNVTGEAARQAARNAFDYYDYSGSGVEVALPVFDALPAGDIKDGAALEMIDEFGDDRPDLLESWADTIVDPTVRRVARKEIERRRPAL